MVDQLPYSLLERYARGLSPDGIFLRVAHEGLSFRNCRYPHAFTFTAPGHALISTGASPHLNGIINNSWFDREANKTINCVSDQDARVIGAIGDPDGVSPRLLAVPTLGDSLKLSTGGSARVFSISL
ncbi:MAG: alkaline phosphatase family protein, partial [Planctomycetes bacterium]|nr:alkaline phosphatase family protein [Planctomycetota bacterium]